MNNETKQQERRRDERKRFRGGVGDVSFSVVVAGKTYDILDVHDVSISGIRLQLAISVPSDTTLILKHVSSDCEIEIQGAVRWCNKTINEGYDLGVEFDAAGRDANILFFMSLRKFLDDFDDVPVKEW